MADDWIIVREMMREGETSADHRGKLRAIAARAEQPDRRQRHVLRHGAHGAERVAFGEPAALEQDQLLKPLQKVVFAFRCPAGAAAHRR